MRKCAQCGNDILNNQIACSKCGYNPENIQKTYAYGNAYNQAQNVQKSKNVGKIIVIVIICMFAAPFVVFASIVIFLGIFFSFNLKNEFDNYGTTACYAYCNGDYTEANGECYCDNGSIYNEFGEFLYNSKYPNGENIYYFPEKIDNWLSDVNSNGTVVTVFCDNNVTCSKYSTVIVDSAKKNGYKLYFYDINKLDDSMLTTMKNTANLTQYFGVHPYTFAVQDGILIAEYNGTMDEEQLKSWLKYNFIME